jgi:hypothetical protein
MTTSLDSSTTVDKKKTRYSRWSLFLGLIAWASLIVSGLALPDQINVQTELDLTYYAAWLAAGLGGLGFLSALIAYGRRENGWPATKWGMILNLLVLLTIAGMIYFAWYMNAG